MIRDFLIRVFTQNLGTKIISFVIALVMWGVVLGSMPGEVTRELAIEVVPPPNLVVANEIPERVSFRLAGPMAFLRTIMDRRMGPIRVVAPGDHPGMVYHRFYPDNIRAPIGVKVLSINPATIQIKLEHLRRKEVAVRPEVRGAPEEGFRVARVELVPPRVRIKGAESHVEPIHELPTLPIDVSGLREPTEKEASIDLSRHPVSLDGSPPRIRIEVVPASANFKVKNVDIRVLTPYKSQLDDRTVTVLARTPSRDLKLENRQVYAVIDLRGRPKGKYPDQRIQVSLPEGVSLVRVIPERVTVTLH